MNRSSSKHTGVFSAACLAMGFMVSPLSMPVAGNSAGVLGYSLLWLLPVAALINFYTVNRYSTILLPQPELRPNATGPRFQTGIAVLQVLAFPPFCIAASTLILAAAGYVFNEVFVRWFPNLLFSVCFLVFIVAVNLIGGKVSRFFQNCSVLLFLGSVLLLVLIGLFAIEKPLLGKVDVPGIISFEPRSVFMLFWIFMAAELAVYHEKQGDDTQQPNPYFIITAFAVVLAVFWLWLLISIAAAPPSALAESTGPQNIAAHFIAGGTGRMIMGAALLAGSFAGVNTLLQGTGSVLNIMLSPAARRWRLSEKAIARKRFTMILSLFILAMLLGGMAGKDITFTIMRAAFYLWLITYAGYNLHILRIHAASGITASMAAGIAVSVLYIAAFVILVATDQQVKEVIFFLR